MFPVASSNKFHKVKTMQIYFLVLWSSEDQKNLKRLKSRFQQVWFFLKASEETLFLITSSSRGTQQSLDA